MSYNTSDFKRPSGVEQGILLNTNNDALATYKKTKKRMASITTLEKTVEMLVAELDNIKRKLDENKSIG